MHVLDLLSSPPLSLLISLQGELVRMSVRERGMMWELWRKCKEMYGGRKTSPPSLFECHDVPVLGGVDKTETLNITSTLGPSVTSNVTACMVLKAT